MACSALTDDVTIKVECDAACDETEAVVSLSSHSSDEGVGVKQEPADLAAACVLVEELYAGHEVKEEMVIGPVVLQPPDACAVLVCREKNKTFSQPQPQPSCEPYNQDVPTAAISTRHNRVRDESLSSDVLSNTATLMCDTCKKEVVIDYNVVQHYKRPAVFTCGICIYWKSQTRHQHIIEKPHTCFICKKQFNQKSNLTTHQQRVHIGENLFSCDACKKQFTSKSYLTAHQRRVHSEEKPFSCDVCEKQFTDKSSLIKHQRVHTGEKPFSCDICKEQFAYKTCLNRHQQVHTGEKPFSCNICKKQFADKSNLIVHQRVHTGEKPFSCDTCKKQFAHKSSLKIHQQIHSE